MTGTENETGSAPQRSITVGRVTVRRAGNRIAEVVNDKDGQGYGDLVSRDVVRDHQRMHVDGALRAKTHDEALEQVHQAAFCEAVLLLRAQEARDA